MKLKISMPAIALISTLLFLLTGCSSVTTNKSANAYFSSWPEGKSPREIGRHVAQHFIESPHQNFGRPGQPPLITYPEVCAWYGALNFAKVTHDRAMKAALVKRFEPLFTTETNL